MRATTAKTAGKKTGASKGKLALVGVLAVVFAGVIASNFRGGAGGNAPVAAVPTPDETPPTAPAPAVANAAAAPASAKAPIGPFGEFENDRPWPKLTLDAATTFDPLAVPEWAQPPKPAEVAATPEQTEAQAANAKLAKETALQEAAAREAALAVKRKAELDALREAANAIILVSAGERIARIGDKEFHIGDEVGGLTIQNITPEGIVLGDAR